MSDRIEPLVAIDEPDSRPGGIIAGPRGPHQPACAETEDPEFAAFIRGRRAEYESGLPRRVRCLWEAVGALAAGEGDRAAVERQAHALAGSAGTFGFVEVGRAARAIALGARLRLAFPFA